MTCDFCLRGEKLFWDTVIGWCHKDGAGEVQCNTLRWSNPPKGNDPTSED